jgi:succinate dehydrogenase / fumarate reductase cytochrome b subunit
LVLHLKDYTLAEQHSAASVVNGQNLGLYGLMANSFKSPVRVIGYLIALFSVGFHLAHGIQSVFQSFGLNHKTYTPLVQTVSTAIGVLFAVAFASIPVYFFFL